MGVSDIGLDTSKKTKSDTNLGGKKDINEWEKCWCNMDKEQKKKI